MSCTTATIVRKRHAAIHQAVHRTLYTSNLQLQQHWSTATRAYHPNCLTASCKASALLWNEPVTSRSSTTKFRHFRTAVKASNKQAPAAEQLASVTPANSAHAQAVNSVLDDDVLFNEYLEVAHDPALHDYRAPHHLLQFSYWKEFGLRLVNGSKQLYHNLQHARKIKLESADQEKPLTRREQRFVHQAYRDVAVGLPWVACFAIPILGYSVILLAHFLPRYLPSVYQLPSVQHAMHVESSQYRRVLLIGLYKAIQKAIANDTSTDQCTISKHTDDSHSRLHQTSRSIEQCIVGKQPLTVDDLHTIAETLMQYVTWDDLTHQHMRRLLIYTGHESMLNPLHFRCVLIYKINVYARNILLDDRRLRAEKVETLLAEEVCMACYNRGLPWNLDDHDETTLRKILRDWLDFTAKYELPGKEHDGVASIYHAVESIAAAQPVVTQTSEADMKQLAEQQQEYIDRAAHSPIILPPTGCRLLRQQEYVSNRLLPIALFHVGVLWGHHKDVERREQPKQIVESNQ